MITNLFFVIITNIVTTITLPDGLCGDIGVMGAFFDTKDTNPVYGLKVEVFDNKTNIIANSWIKESYVPPMSETIVVTLNNQSKYARCEIFGTNLPGKWKDAYFYVGIQPPKISYNYNQTNLQLNWTDYFNCWGLEKTTNGTDWKPSKNLISVTNKLEFFRLRRSMK